MAGGATVRSAGTAPVDCWNDAERRIRSLTLWDDTDLDAGQRGPSAARGDGSPGPAAAGRPHVGTNSGLARQYEPTGEEALTPAADTRTGGVFVYQELPLARSSDSLGRAASAGRLGRSRVPHLELGARLDGYRIESQAGESFGPGRARGFTNLSASLGLSVPLGRGISLGVNTARAFRAPTVEELFSNAFHAAVGAFDVGDPSLEAETSLGGEGVVRVQRDRASGQFAAHYSRIAAYIAPFVEGDTTTDEGDLVPLNRYAQYDAALAGLEAQIEWIASRRIVLGFMGDLTRGRFIDRRRSGESLPFMPAARVGGSVRWDDGRYAFGTEVRHACPQRDPAPGEYRAGAYTLVDIHAGVTRVVGPAVHSITLRADNLFDVRYREATSRIKDFAPNPGRNVALVYRVLF